MNENEIGLKATPRLLSFTGVLQVVDCIDYDNPKVVFCIEKLRDTFMSIFPDEVFKETSFRFFTDTNGTEVTMEIHDLNVLYKYIESMEHMKHLGIKWDKIYKDIRELHVKE